VEPPSREAYHYLAFSKSLLLDFHRMKLFSFNLKNNIVYI